MELLFSPFQRCFDFGGRSRRLEYWLFVALNFVVTSFVVLLFFAFTPADLLSALLDEGLSDDEFMGLCSQLLHDPAIFTLVVAFTTYDMFVIIPGIALTVRRLHDCDMTGWYYPVAMLCSLIPIAGLLAVPTFGVIMMRPGTKGDNRYGPSPRNSAIDRYLW